MDVQDPLILIKVQLHRGLTHEAACANLEPLKAAMVKYALAHKPPSSPNASGLVLLPGVKVRRLSYVRACDLARFFFLNLAPGSSAGAAREIARAARRVRRTGHRES